MYVYTCAHVYLCRHLLRKLTNVSQRYLGGWDYWFSILSCVLFCLISGLFPWVPEAFQWSEIHGCIIKLIIRCWSGRKNFFLLLNKRIEKKKPQNQQRESKILHDKVLFGVHKAYFQSFSFLESVSPNAVSLSRQNLANFLCSCALRTAGREVSLT